MEKTYYNVICEEQSILGGKIIHIDKNLDNMELVHNLVCENVHKYPRAKWELYRMSVQYTAKPVRAERNPPSHSRLLLTYHT